MDIGTARAALSDDRYATALHESGHAVAYIGQGKNFRYLTMRPRNGACGMLQPHHRPIDALTKAVTCMAGPAVEGLLLAAARSWTDTEVIEWITDNHREAVESGEYEGEFAETGDYTDAGPYALFALPMALTVVAANWSNIERIAAVLMESRRALTYRDVIGLLENNRAADITSAYGRWHVVTK